MSPLRFSRRRDGKKTLDARARTLIVLARDVTDANASRRSPRSKRVRTRSRKKQKQTERTPLEDGFVAERTFSARRRSRFSIRPFASTRRENILFARSGTRRERSDRLRRQPGRAVDARNASGMYIAREENTRAHHIVSLVIYRATYLRTCRAPSSLNKSKSPSTRRQKPASICFRASLRLDRGRRHGRDVPGRARGVRRVS